VVKPELHELIAVIFPLGVCRRSRFFQIVDVAPVDEVLRPDVFRPRVGEKIGREFVYSLIRK
jgi:hypothetical protein